MTEINARISVIGDHASLSPILYLHNGPWLKINPDKEFTLSTDKKVEIHAKPKFTLNAFYIELQQHDWLYDYSDDQSVWNRGFNNEQRLRQIASNNKWLQLFTDYKSHVLHKTPKPNLEDYR